MKNGLKKTSTIGAALLTAMLLACPVVLANPVEIDTDWTFEMTDGDTAITFEFTSFGEEEDEKVSVQWKDGDTWVTLPGTWEMSGTVTVSGSGESWELDRVARTVPCPDDGDWSFRLAYDYGPEHPIDYPMIETARCTAAGENADDYYDLDNPVESCSLGRLSSEPLGLVAILLSLI